MKNPAILPQPDAKQLHPSPRGLLKKARMLHPVSVRILRCIVTESADESRHIAKVTPVRCGSHSAVFGGLVDECSKQELRGLDKPSLLWGPNCRNSRGRTGRGSLRNAGLQRCLRSNVSGKQDHGGTIHAGPGFAHTIHCLGIDMVCDKQRPSSKVDGAFTECPGAHAESGCPGHPCPARRWSDHDQIHERGMVGETVGGALS